MRRSAEAWLGRATHRLAALALGLALLGPVPAPAHDASAYGGVFRSRNAGVTWLGADAGLFLNAALAVAVDPRDPAHLLLGTDTGLLRSRNGGRSWVPDARGALFGPVFAAAFSPDGGVALCAATGGVFRFADRGWERARVPPGAAPARVIAFGANPGRVYLLGQGGLFASDDNGRSFAYLPGLPQGDAPATALAVSVAPEEMLFALVGGALLASADGGSHWERRGGDAGWFEALLYDPAPPGRLWAATGGALATSDDQGRHWRRVGRLPDPNMATRGIAADAGRVILTSDRGMFRSLDGGQTWQLEESGLPVHIESGPLARDPSDRRTLYAVYSLMPYSEVWRAALEGSNLLSRVDVAQLAGGGAFMLLLLLAGGLLVRRLAGASPPIPGGRPE